MCNLLRSGIFRYSRSTVFKVCISLTIIFALLFSYRIYTAAEINEFCFMFETVIFAVLITFMIGNETSKCIRNKIPIGYTKTQIYFSELILANFFVIIFYAIFLVFAVIMNFRLLSHVPLKLALQAIFGFLAMMLLLANVFAAISSMVSSKTVTAVVCLILVIFLSITNLLVVNMLKEEEFFKMGSNESGEWETWEEKNPAYVDEPLRSVLTFYRDTNPYGQRAEYENILLPFLYEDESLERAMAATADTIGNDFLQREVSESEQAFLNRTPFIIVTPIPFFIIAGWLVFRRKSFR